MLSRILTSAPLAALLGVLLAAGPAPAQPPGGDEAETVARVNKAIDRGVQFLRTKHQDRTHWDAFWLNQLGGMQGGVTALATLALLNCGVRPEEREVKLALDFLRTVPRERTYVVGLATMVFAEARQPRDLPRIQENVDWLAKTAVRSRGKIVGWSYPLDGQRGEPDGSNTQYALLGLYAGKQAGAKIDDAVWQEVRQLYLDGQGREGPDAGFWTYTRDRGLSRPSFTMTAAGVSGLLIADMGLNSSQQGLDPATGVAANCGRYVTNDPVARGLNWLGQRFSFDRPQGSDWTYYNIYGIERVGRLSGQRFLGRADWYREGCEYLVRAQVGDGSFAPRDNNPVDGLNVVSTSFALLFLSKGRSPVLVSKLAYGDAVMPDRGVLVEKGDTPGVIEWNRKHNDARHLTEFAGRELFDGMTLGWQVYDPRRRDFPKPDDILAEVGVLVQSPVLYFNGHKRPRLTGQQKQILRRYIEEGGFVLAEACCGSEEFTAGFRELMKDKDVFPDSQLQPVPPEHAIWRSHFAVPPTEFPRLECLDRGCRTVVVFSPQPLAGYWEESRFMVGKGTPDKAPAKPGEPTYRGEQAFRLAANVIAYATGMEPPKQRLSARKIVDPGKGDLSPPRGFVKPAQLKLRDESPPAPAAMRNLMTHLQTAARIDVTLDTKVIEPSDDELFKYKFMYLHGRKRFTFSDEEIENVKANLQSGGLLFADACCGKPEFDAGFREMVGKMFPDRKLELVPLDDDLYSAKLNGVPVTTVKRRDKSDAAGGESGFRDVPPHLEGIRIDGRWVVLYSKYDVGCALEGHKSTDCLGHTRDSALQIATAAALYALKR